MEDTQDKPCNPLVVAIDYDMTITRAPNEFTRLLMLMKSMHWNILIVTDRDPGDREEELRWLAELADDVIFVNGEAKIDALEDLGIDVDIWIDDNPVTIIDGVPKNVH
jgi:hypothetical protein